MAEQEQVNSKMITYDQLAENFHLPINEVSKKLGICTTVLKKVCRRNGIPRWPYRKLKALDKKISNLKASLQKNPQESKRIHAEIVALQERKRLIMENPSCLSIEPTSTESNTPTTFDEAYDDLNSSALLLSLTPNRDQDSPEPSTKSRSSRKPSPKVPRLSLSAGRTEEEEEELLVASNLVELMSFGSMTPNSSITQTPLRSTTKHQSSSSSFSSSYIFTPSHSSSFSSSHPIIAPSFSTSPLPTPSTTSPPQSFANMPMINPRSFFSPEECAPPIPHTQTSKSPTPLSAKTPSTKPTPLRSFSSAPILESLSEEQQPPLPSWFSRSLEEAVNDQPIGPEPKKKEPQEQQPQPQQQQPQQQQPQQQQPQQQQPQQHQQPTPRETTTQTQPIPRPETPSGTKRAGRDVETLEAETRTQNSLPTKRSRNESPNVRALSLPSLIIPSPKPISLS